MGVWRSKAIVAVFAAGVHRYADREILQPLCSPRRDEMSTKPVSRSGSFTHALLVVVGGLGSQRAAPVWPGKCESRARQREGHLEPWSMSPNGIHVILLLAASGQLRVVLPHRRA